MLPNITDIIKIAQGAGKKILAVYQDQVNFQIVENKADSSPLTLADKASHKYISAELKKLYPQIPILSEEGKNISFNERKDWDLFWMIDPLDGTKEFIKRNGEFTVNIALIEKNKVVLGVVHVPVKKWTYAAEKGKGAFKQDEHKETAAIHANTFSFEDKNLKIVASRSHNTPETAAFISQFDSPELVSMGSSLKLLLVAEGKADVYPRLAPTMEWDTAAAQIIVEEAGGKVVLENQKDPVLYNKENLLNPYFIVLGNKK